MNSIGSWIKIHSLAFRQFIEVPPISVMNNRLDSQHCFQSVTKPLSFCLIQTPFFRGSNICIIWI